jgi:hypothetical protein
MDVLETKAPLHYKDDLKRIIKMLTFKKNKLELKGSSSLVSQRFFSDYDLFCVIEKPDEASFVAFLQHLLKTIEESEDYWMIELKFQTKSGKKVRYYPHQPLKEADVGKVWKQLDFVKLDLIARIENRFTEVSVIYSMTPTVPTSEEYISSLEQDIKELKKEKKFYKVLKRQFNIHKANGDKAELLRLSKVFNGSLGEQYQLISNLEAIQMLLEHYQEPEVLKKVMVNLKDLHLEGDIDDVEKWVKDKSKKLNDEAKKML